MATRDIVEVREVGFRRVNELLALGYQLLLVEQVTNGVERAPNTAGPAAATFWVRKNVIYVVGRTAQQPSIEDALHELNTRDLARRAEAEKQGAERLAEREAAVAAAGVSS